MPSIISTSSAGVGGRPTSGSSLPLQQQQQDIQMPGLMPSITSQLLPPGFSSSMPPVQHALLYPLPPAAAVEPQSFMDIFMDPDPEGMFPQQHSQPQQSLLQPAQQPQHFDVSLMPPHLVKQGKQAPSTSGPQPAAQVPAISQIVNPSSES